MMRRSMFAIGGFAIAVGAGLAIYWRWFPRAGVRWANESVNPWLVRRGLVGVGRSELGTIEHVGRRTGTRHLTPIHPVPTPDGFRIVVPLADKSEWAKNVLAAGHCRLQFRDVVYELDEPQMVHPADVRDLPRIARALEGWLGFTYLRLHRFGEQPGRLEEPDGQPASAPSEVAKLETGTTEFAKPEAGRTESAKRETAQNEAAKPVKRAKVVTTA